MDLADELMFDVEVQETKEREDKKAKEVEERKEKDDIKWLMSMEPGRRIMWRLLGKTGVYRMSFTGDMASTSFREGERNIGLSLLAKVHNYTPSSYNKMVEEHEAESDSRNLAEFL